MMAMATIPLAAALMSGALVLPELHIQAEEASDPAEATVSEPDGDAGSDDVTAAIEKIMEDLAWEPGCDEVVRAALEHIGSPGGKLPSARRLRLTGLLPTFRITVERSVEYDEYLDQDHSGEVDLGVDTDDDIEIRASLQWDLGSLAYSSAESGMISRKLQLARWRAEIAKEMVRLWHERRKLQVLMRLPAGYQQAAGKPADLLATSMRVMELTAIMDAWTGGWYTQELERRLPAVVGKGGGSGSGQDFGAAGSQWSGTWDVLGEGAGAGSDGK